MKINSVEDLEVFKKAHKLTLNIYNLSENFPKNEIFGLTSQMRRASYSICANLLEGSHRNNTKEFKQFTGIANGSAGELKYYILLARDLNYISFKEYNFYISELNSISKMLRGLIKSLINTNTNTNTNTLKEEK